MNPLRTIVIGLVGVALLVAACGGGENAGTDRDATSAPAPAGSPEVVVSGGLLVVDPLAPLDRAYKFDDVGSLSLEGDSELPAARGAVAAHWYRFRGWYALAFEGLDAAISEPLCVGVAFRNAVTNQVEYVSNAPTASGACDDAGVGAAAIAPAAFGVRDCGETIAYLTPIPADIQGVLVATLTRYSGDGVGVGLSSWFESAGEGLEEIEARLVDCGELPEARVMRPPVVPQSPLPEPLPVPPSAGSVSAADRTPPPAPVSPDKCVVAVAGELQDVETTAAGPYLIFHPATAPASAPTVVFLPGGSGGRGSAGRIWESYFGSGARLDSMRVVIPYSLDAPFIDDAARTFAILDEVLWCSGGDPSKVHLAGVSNGGLAAFGLMIAQPERFATLLGAPGAFPVQDPSTVDPAVWATALAGRAVFNGVGANDDDWRVEVIATHNALAAAGVESRYVEFPDQGHIAGPTFDEGVLLEFWTSH